MLCVMYGKCLALLFLLEGIDPGSRNRKEKLNIYYVKDSRTINFNSRKLTLYKKWQKSSLLPHL